MQKNSHVFKKQDSTSYDFSFEIKSFLEENGFLLDYKVGNSDMKIDICIKDKESNNYVYAIETDGESFKLAKNTRDRERLRKEILEKMGFNVIRIWSTEWYRNEKVAKDILLERLNNSNIHSIVEESIVPITINNDENTFKNYIRVNDEDILESFRSIEEDFERVMLEYLTIEGPILELDLLKRLLPIFKQEKINNQVKSEFELMKAMWLDLGKVKTNEGFIFLDKQEVIFRVPLENDKPRDIRSISIEEISKGMKKMIEKNKNVEKEGLFKSLMKIMGYTRMNEHIHNRFEETLKFLLKTDLIRVNKDIISIIDLSKK